MKVVVWDTYVPRKDGLTMHFDILVPDTVTDADTIFGYGRDYLQSKAFETGALTAKECVYCHMEQATDDIVSAIQQQGYYIIEMENCR